MFSLRGLTVLAILAARVIAIPQVTRVGKLLYTEDGARFYVEGIGYQEQGEVHESDDNPFGEPGTFTDPLANPEACARDAVLFQDAGINAIRVYTVDSNLNHDACMASFSEAGIYTIIDLSQPVNGSIARADASWSQNLLDVYLKTIDAFAAYDNVLAYNVGNEVVIDSPSTASIPFVKAAARDVKAYLQSRNLNVMVGYATIDGALRYTLADYLSCGSEEEAIDIYGLNSYSWCSSEGSYEGSFAGLVSEFADYNVATYLSEYGCVRAGTRDFSEVPALLSPEMTEVWSGGIAFTWFPVVADGSYGMCTGTADDCTPTEEFNNLATQYTAATGPDTPAQASVSESTYATCPVVAGASNILPGTPDHEACSCLLQGLTCRVTPDAAANVDLGPLIGTACGLLEGSGGDCLDIGSDGATGIYGTVSGCTPEVKLSYVMSRYYEAEGNSAAACDLDGNVALNPSPSDTAAASLASTCIPSPDAVFVPSLPDASSTSPAEDSSTTTSRPGSTSTQGTAEPTRSNDSGALAGMKIGNSVFGMGAMAVVTLVSGLWVLA